MTRWLHLSITRIYDTAASSDISTVLIHGKGSAHWISHYSGRVVGCMPLSIPSRSESQTLSTSHWQQRLLLKQLQKHINGSMMSAIPSSLTQIHWFKWINWVKRSNFWKEQLFSQQDDLKKTVILFQFDLERSAALFFFLAERKFQKSESDNFLSLISPPSNFCFFLTIKNSRGLIFITNTDRSSPLLHFEKKTHHFRLRFWFWAKNFF